MLAQFGDMATSSYRPLPIGLSDVRARYNLSTVLYNRGMEGDYSVVMLVLS